MEMNTHVKRNSIWLHRLQNVISLHTKMVVWFEIAAVFGFAFLLIWVIAPLKNNLLTVGSVLLVLSFICLVYFRNGETRKTLGLDTKYLISSGFYCLVVTLGMAIVLGIGGYLAGTLRWELALIRRIFWYFFWAAFQQLFFQIFFTTQFKKVFANKYWVALCSALVFSLIHLPNSVLMGATLVSGFFWALIYFHFPNLFTIAVSHATLAVLLKFSLSNALTFGLRIGPGCP